MLLNIAVIEGKNRAFLFITCPESHIKIAPTTRFAHIWNTTLLLPVMKNSNKNNSGIGKYGNFSLFLLPQLSYGEKIS